MAQRGTQEKTEDKAKNIEDNKTSEESCTVYEQFDRAWDDILSDKQNEPNVYKHIFLRCFKLLFYIVLVLVLIVGVIVTRGSLQILASQLGNHSRRFQQRTVTQDVISYMFFFIIAIPDLLKLLQSVGKCAFGNREYPTYKRFFMVMVREAFHVFGLGCLLFRVMPNIDPLQTCVLTLSVSFFPSVSSLIMSIKDCEPKKNKKRILLNSLSSIFSLSSLIGVILTLNFSNEVTNAKHLQKKENITIWTLTAVSMLSTRWMENCFHQSKIDGYNTLPNEAEPTGGYKGYVISNICSSCLRLMLLIILFPTVFCYGVRGLNDAYEKYIHLSTITGLVPFNCTEISKLTNITETIDNSTVVCNEEGISYWLVFGQLLAHNAGAFLTTHFGVLACRLRMQLYGFAVPLLIATPLYVIIVIMINETPINFANDLLFLRSDQKWILIVLFVIGWAGQFIFCKHVFKNNKERIELARRLFVLPHYCSAMVDLALIHSRNEDKSTTDVNSDKNENCTVYICATMWHESKLEMKKLLRSIFRLYSCYTERHFNFEVHIIFDDALVTEEDGSKSENRYVKRFNRSVKEIFYDRCQLPGLKFNESPERRETPYGRRLEWKNPKNDNLPCLVVHLKDTAKVRQKKRWSQIMYMFYIVEYVICTQKGKVNAFKEKDRTDEQSGEGGEGGSERQNEIESDVNNKTFPCICFNLEINWVTEGEYDKGEPGTSNKTINIIKTEASKCFILALDGDVDFRPEAIQLLLDRMKINQKVGATCGRILPDGSGPIVWYQRFEYAIGHWLQKSAEHIFGCVLCTPGCFSLFRVEALVDVLPIYAKESTEARQFLQYDQGEDRWLCTLLLQRGYKIEYCAAAEAITYAPEEFTELFNQRRRWIPSTMANMVDLFVNYKQTIIENRYISHLYIFYLTVLFISTLLGPSTVLLALESAIASVFGISHWLAYFLTFGPTILFVIICLKTGEDTQLKWANVLSAIFALLMIAVFVGTIISITIEGWYTPSGVFFYTLAGTFVITGLLHPYGLGDLLCGFIYFICIPAGYLFLVIYAICNLNNISWGTRENKATAKPTGQNNKTGLKEGVKHSNDEQADIKENEFWERLVNTRLKCLVQNTEEDDKIKEMMTNLRNKVAVMVLFLNVLWLTFMIIMNEAKYIFNFTIPTRPPILIEPLGFSFIVVFTILVALQFIAMLIHRYETMLHILSKTILKYTKYSCGRSKKK